MLVLAQLHGALRQLLAAKWYRLLRSIMDTAAEDGLLAMAETSLRRCDLDLEAGELSVVQQRQPDRHGQHLVGQPKTAAG